MKILFLDMDGVLNSMPDEDVRLTWKNDKELYMHRLYGIDPELAKKLKKIIDATDCKIVVSSSWRYFKDHHVEGEDWRKTLAELAEFDVSRFIGNTPDIMSRGAWCSGYERRRRGLEIQMWLENNTDIAEPGKYTFCVLDDETGDITPVIKENVIETNYKTGLSDNNVELAIKILNKDCQI